MNRTNILILGASGQIARRFIQFLQDKDSLTLTLFLRNANDLSRVKSSNVKIVEGDVLNQNQLNEAINEQDF